MKDKSIEKLIKKLKNERNEYCSKNVNKSNKLDESNKSNKIDLLAVLKQIEQEEQEEQQQEQEKNLLINLTQLSQQDDFKNALLNKKLSVGLKDAFDLEILKENEKQDLIEDEIELIDKLENLIVAETKELKKTVTPLDSVDLVTNNNSDLEFELLQTKLNELINDSNKQQNKPGELKRIDEIDNELLKRLDVSDNAELLDIINSYIKDQNANDPEESDLINMLVPMIADPPTKTDQEKLKQDILNSIYTSLSLIGDLIKTNPQDKSIFDQTVNDLSGLSAIISKLIFPILPHTRESIVNYTGYLVYDSNKLKKYTDLYTELNKLIDLLYKL